MPRTSSAASSAARPFEKQHTARSAFAGKSQTFTPTACLQWIGILQLIFSDEKFLSARTEGRIRKCPLSCRFGNQHLKAAHTVPHTHLSRALTTAAFSAAIRQTALQDGCLTQVLCTAQQHGPRCQALSGQARSGDGELRL